MRGGGVGVEELTGSQEWVHRLSRTKASCTFHPQPTMTPLPPTMRRHRTGIPNPSAGIRVMRGWVGGLGVSFSRSALQKAAKTSA
jgi:hypothetical protein